MTSSVRLGVLALLCLPAGAGAQSAYQTRALAPGSWDLRFGVEADGLLAHAGANASAELGLFSLGEGSLSLGVEGALGHCLHACGSEGQQEVSRWAASPMGRLAWHYVLVSQSANAAEVDLYAVALGGAGFVFQESRSPGARLSSASRVPLLGGGLGSVYFPGNGESVFAGGELRVFYSPATPELAGSGLTLTAWSLAGVRFMFSMGVRL